MGGRVKVISPSNYFTSSIRDHYFVIWNVLTSDTSGFRFYSAQKFYPFS